MAGENIAFFFPEEEPHDAPRFGVLPNECESLSSYDESFVELPETGRELLRSMKDLASSSRAKLKSGDWEVIALGLIRILESKRKMGMSAGDVAQRLENFLNSERGQSDFYHRLSMLGKNTPQLILEGFRSELERSNPYRVIQVMVSEAPTVANILFKN